MVVGAIQPAVGKPGLEPAEDRLVADVHPQHHLRLAPVPAERALADEQADEEASVEVRELRHGAEF